MQKLGPGIIIGGLVLLGAALGVFFGVVPKLIDSKVKEETRLVEGSDTWNKWKDVTVPVRLSFYVFHVTNPYAIQNGEKFILEERGPYVYEEKREKTILRIHEEKDTVTYKESKTYFFNRNLSVGDQTDTFNTINFPLVTLSTILKKTVFSLANPIINSFLRPVDADPAGAGENFVRENITVAELFFEGFPIHPWYNKFIAATGSIPPEFENDRFGFYRGKNGTDDGIYEIYSGVKDHTRFGQILKWEGGEELDWWTDPALLPHEEQYCNKINGSDGTVFPPFVEKSRVLRAFVTDICRSIFLTYNSDIEYKDIPAYRFTVPKEMLANPKDNPDNQCFCTNPGGGLAAHCAGGLIRINACQNDAPVFTSNPHFLDADADIINAVEGLKPDRELHQTALDVEPRSGQLVQATKRIQIGVEIQPLNGIPAFGDVPAPSVNVPLFWAEEYAALSDEDVEDLKDQLLKPLKLIKIIQWSVIAVTGAIVVIGLVITYRRRRKNVV